MIRLRGHHLFCCTLFQGSGYDGTFASRMAQVMERLQAGEEIWLGEGCGHVCAACPNRRGAAGCALGTENVARRDAAARQATGVSLGEEFFPGEAGKKLRAVSREQWETACACCRWKEEGLCSWELFVQFRSQRFV